MNEQANFPNQRAERRPPFVERSIVKMIQFSTNKPLWLALSSAILFTLLTLMLAGTTLAADESADPVAQAEKQLKVLEARLETLNNPSQAQLKEMEASLQEVRQVARSCLDEVEQTQRKLDRELAILDPSSTKTTADGDGTVTEQKPQTASSTDRHKLDLSERTSALNARRSSCQLLRLHSDELESTLDQFRQEILTRQLLQRDTNLLQLIEQNLAKPGVWLDFSSEILVKSSGLRTVQGLHLAGIVLLGVLGWFAGLLIRRKVRPLAMPPAGEEELSRGLYHSVLASIARYAPILLFFAAFSLYLELLLQQQPEQPYFVLLINGLLLYLLAVATIRTFLRPVPPARSFLELPERVAQRLSRRLQVLALLLLIGKLLRVLGSEEIRDPAMDQLARAVWHFLVVLNAVWIIWLMQRLERWRERWGIGAVLSLAFVSSLAAMWLGYQELGRLVILGLIGTLFGLALTLLGTGLLDDLFDGLDEGRHPWQRRLRQAVGVKDGDYVPGLGWLRLLANLMLWGGFAAAVLSVWGLSEQGFTEIHIFLTEGFQVAGFNIVPSRLLLAVLVFALLMTLSRWFTNKLNSTWLKKTRMDHGAREALVTFSRYTVIALAILFALSLAGIEFTNLAIVAGALSVGIGFGLQNVVNNFVSGLILLFERPVRTGDWIVVGNTQGTVKRISIRSTTVQTFERADVIVPNSELISGQVTNWTLDTPWGRLSVPVGVAYGSDTAKVKQLLLEVGNAHPLVVRDNPRWPKPNALFLAFGASSLDFELRVIVRDISERAQVISDLNFAIDKAFRDNDIEIPFPQQDVYLKQVPEGLRNDRGEPPGYGNPDTDGQDK